MLSKIKTKINKKIVYRVFALGLLVFGATAFLLTQTNSVAQAVGISKIINFQGKITAVSNGTNVADGIYAMRFKLYDALTSGNLLWTETYDQPSGACTKPTLTSGIFNVKLGSCNSLASIDFTTGSLYLSVDFAPTGTSYDGEMSPLKQLNAAPFAFVANNLAGDGIINILNTGSNQATIGHSAGNTVVINVASNGATTMTASGAGAAFLFSGGNVSVDSASTIGFTSRSKIQSAADGNISLLNNAGNAFSLLQFGGTSSSFPALKRSSAVLQVKLADDSGYANLDAGSILTGGTARIDSSGNLTNIVAITASGAVTAVGANAGAGLLQGSLGLTITGAEVSLNASSNFDTNINTGTSNGTVTIGNSSSANIKLGKFTTANGVLYVSATDGTVAETAASTGAQCLQTAGSGTAPIWGSCGAGGGGTLQQSYDLDADGSDATISLTAADDGLIFTNPSSSGTDTAAFLLQLSQANTTANVLALDIIQSSNAANGVNLVANAIDTETGLSITANAITSGRVLSANSSSTGLTSGNAVAEFTLSGSNALNLGSVLKLSNTGTASGSTGLYIDHRATGTGNLAFRIDDESGDSTPFIVDGEGRVGIGTSSISNGSSSERLLQVGSETNRGNSVTYGDVVSKGLDRHTQLTGIKDIFVYDTTGDSDGGRWIDWATTDNLSWYSEALDDGPNDPCVIASDDRCYNKAFPRKAILIVTTNALYIFDAATNDMWMKFSQDAAVWALGVDTNNDPSSVTALNGVIYVGANGTAPGGLYAYDFVNDRMWNYNGTNRSAATTGISGRNAAVTYNVDSNVKLEISPVATTAQWEKVNDVYAQVMSHTITAATALGGATNTNPGQGKVYVALATDAGVTVINMTDRVLLQYSDVTDDDYTAVVISRKGHLYALNTTQDQLERWDSVDLDKTSRVNGTYTRRWDETIGSGPALATAAFNILPGAPDNLEVSERSSLALDTEDIIYVGHSLGMAELHDHTTQAAGWVKYFNQTRQTPMMPLAGYNDMVLPMDDTSGTQAQDLAIANTDMAIKGTPTLGVDGVQGKAINFDNTDDFLCSDADQNNTCDVDTAFNMSTTGWTLSLWFKHSTTAPSGSIDTIFEKCVTATPAAAVGCVIAYMNTSGNIVVANDATTTWTRPDGGGAATYDITATSTYAYNDNQWHQLVITRTNANDVDSWIDGQGMNLSTATGQTATFDASQIVTIGASCSTSAGANCTTQQNFWDGQIDDVQFIGGTTTLATMTQLYVRRLYNSERPRVSKKTISVTDTTSADSTSVTDTGESWLANEFAGSIVEITGSSDADCIGLTRRISSNTSNSITFTPAVPGACAMDSTGTDFQVDPEALYGGSDVISGIGITAESPLGEARQMCVGTNSGSDTGGVTCYNHQAGPSIVADVYHSQASQTDDSGTDWTGSNYDEIMAIDLSTRTLVMASEAHFTSITEDVRLGQGLDYVANQLYMIRMETMLDGITTAGSTAAEVGFTGGADLAEYYYSLDPLEAGDVVTIDTQGNGDDVVKSRRRYSGGLLGVVSTQPGIILGQKAEDGFAIALTGRVPVKFSMENGPVKAGDYLTSASIPGFAMRATGAGPTIGKALADSPPVEQMVDCPVSNLDVAGLASKCSVVVIFVEHGNFSGLPIEQLMREMQITVSTEGVLVEGSNEGLVEGETEILSGAGLEGEGQDSLTTDEKILVFLKHIKETKLAAGQGVSAELFTDRVSAAFEVISPQVTTSGLKVETIGKLGGAVEIFSDLSFIGRPYFTTDTAGFALIRKGERSIDVVFEKEYLEQPIVNASVTLDRAAELKTETDENKIAQIKQTQEEAIRSLFAANVQYLITNKSEKGFTLILKDQAPQDITFSWIALAVKSAKLFSSKTAPVEINPSPQPVVAGDSTVLPSDPAPDNTPPSDENQDQPPVNNPPPDEAAPQPDPTSVPESNVSSGNEESIPAETNP